MKMRTIDQAIEYIHRNDPETAITKHALRSMLKDGRLPYVQVGKKHLIALETLDELFHLTLDHNEDSKIERNSWDVT